MRRPPAKSVARALVAPEGGVGDDARVPRERLVGRDLDREVGAPARALVVEVDELVEREHAAEAPPQLGLDLARDALERRLLLGVRLVQPPQPALPLLPRALVRHAVRIDRRPSALQADLLDDVRALAGLDHAEAPRLALQRARGAEIGLAFAQPLVLDPQLGDLRALAPASR